MKRAFNKLSIASLAISLLAGCTCCRQECRRSTDAMAPAEISTIEVDAILSNNDVGYLDSKHSHVAMLHYINGKLTPFVISAEYAEVKPRTSTEAPKNLEVLLNRHSSNWRRLQLDPAAIGNLTAEPLSWNGAVVLSESVVKDAELLKARERIGNPPSFCFPLDRVAPTILTWTQGNPARMAAVYIIGPNVCLPMVATQTGPGGNWQLFEVLNWSKESIALQKILKDPSMWWMADATRLDDMTERACH